MIIGGGQWQVPLVRRAREMGLFTVVTDRSGDAPARRAADKFYQVDASDYDALVDVARQCEAELVVAEATDRHVPAAAYVNERLGLRGTDRATAERFTNKYSMRRALEHSSVCMPRYAEVRSVDEAVRFARASGYPVVLKPKALQASVGVYRVGAQAELEERFGSTLGEATDGAILVEEFVDGPEVTVEAFSLDGCCTVLAISEKEHYAHNPCIARRLAYPPRLPGEVIDAIALTARQVVETLGLRDGLSHAEYRLRDGKPYLVEVGARGGGNAIASNIVPHVSGVDVYGLLLRTLLGERVGMPEVQHRAAVLQFLDLRPGKIVDIRGTDRIAAEGLVPELKLAFGPGDTVVAPESDTARAGYFIALGDTRDEVDAVCARVGELLQVEYAA